MKKLASILLALIMLISNVGFSMNIHYCGGHAVETSFSIGMNELDCGMENKSVVCASNEFTTTQLTPDPCCTNQHQIIQLDENSDILSSSVNINSIFFIAFVHALVQSVIFADQTPLQNAFNALPFIDKDIQILFQTFLI